MSALRYVAKVKNAGGEIENTQEATRRLIAKLSKTSGHQQTHR